MKADGGALVYIVIAVISLIVSAIGKSKKKGFPPVSQEPSSAEPQAPSQEPKATWQKELEDIFGQTIGQPEVVVEGPKYEEPEAPGARPEVKVEPEISKVEELNKYAELKGATIIEPKTEHTEAIHFVEDEHETAAFNKEDFELSKAVIYAEILNRKYF